MLTNNFASSHPGPSTPCSGREDSHSAFFAMSWLAWLRLLSKRSCCRARWRKLVGLSATGSAMRSLPLPPLPRDVAAACCVDPKRVIAFSSSWRWPRGWMPMSACVPQKVNRTCYLAIQNVDATCPLAIQLLCIWTSADNSLLNSYQAKGYVLDYHVSLRGLLFKLTQTSCQLTCFALPQKAIRS